MASDFPLNSPEEETYLFDINNSNNINEYKYCPHILNHYLNPFLNSIFEKINITNNCKKQNNENKTDADKNKIIYAYNLSMFQNNLKSFNYLGYSHTRNLYTVIVTVIPPPEITE